MNKNSLKSFIVFVATLIAIPTFLLQYWQYKENHGGKLGISLMTHQLSNNDERALFVYISDTTQRLNGICVTPIFDNSSQYPINGFDLCYEVDIADGNAPQSNSFYDVVKSQENSYEYRFRDRTLYQFSSSPEPFLLSDFPLVNSRYIITSKASYSGAKEPYVYVIKLWIRLVPKSANQSVEDWKLTCKEHIRNIQTKIDTYDIFYCYDGKKDYEFGKDLGTNTSSETKYATDIDKTNGDDIKSDYKESKQKTNNTKKYENDIIHIIDLKDSIIHSRKSHKPYKSRYLSIQNNRNFKKDSLYLGVCHKARQIFDFFPDRRYFYIPIKFTGNGKDTITFDIPFFLEPDYVEATKEDPSLLKHLIFSKTKENGIVVKSDQGKRFVLLYFDGVSENYIVVSKYPTPIYATSLSSIKPIMTYGFEGKPFHVGLWKDCIRIFFIFIGLLSLFLFFFPSEGRQWKENIFYLIYFGSILLVLILYYTNGRL